MNIPQARTTVQSPIPVLLPDPSTAGTFDPISLPVVRVGRLWLPREAAKGLPRCSWSQLPLEIARVAVRKGLRRMGELPQGMLTQHALLVAWGDFAHEIGLIQRLLQVPIPQKSIVHTPQGKVLSFLIGMLSGITHLRDLNEGPHPLAHDWLAIRAWRLAALAHYSNISRTLAACDEKTVAAIRQVLQEVSRPFIEEEVALLRQKNRPLIIDLDLAPRRVSNSSTTFPGAEFGWQDNEVGLGYDAALAALTSPSYGRLFLSGFHHPRNTVPLSRLQKMVRETEARLGGRPRRRTELVQQRLRALRRRLEQRLGWLEQQLLRRRTLQAQLEALPQQRAQLEDQVAQLEQTYRARGRPERPHSQLAKARRQLAALKKKQTRLPQQLQRAERATATHQKRLAELQAAYDALKAHLAQLQADNEANPDPLTIILRIDAGFSTGDSLAWLIEMGYIVYTKARNNRLATRLSKQLAAERPWSPVGKNAEMISCGQQFVRNCPYPLRTALERFHTPDGLKQSALLVYRDDDQELTLPAWFAFYNARQLIEAGIKEGNVVFKMHPLKMRSPGGIALQEQFALFAANFVRWAAVWLRQRVTHSTRRFDEALGRVKTMVRVAANTSAWVQAEDGDLLLMFDETGAYPGVELRLEGVWRSRSPILPQKKVQEFDFKNDFDSDCA